MVSVLAIGLKVYGFLRVIKIHSAPSFGGEVKPLAPCHKILWHIKNSYEV
jgi:hypothetical protein